MAFQEVEVRDERPITTAAAVLLLPTPNVEPRPAGLGPGEDPPTTTGHGNLSERRTTRGAGGSVAGWARVCAGTAMCVVQSTTVRVDGVYRTS